jgi:hypothetical protein
MFDHSMLLCVQAIQLVVHMRTRIATVSKYVMCMQYTHLTLRSYGRILQCRPA